MTARNTSRACIASRGAGGSHRQKRRNPLPAAVISAIQSQLGYKLSDEGLKRVAKVYKLNPGKGAFERCVAAVTAKGGAVDPKAVCAAQAMRTAAGKKELLAAAAKGRKRHKANFSFGSTTYSAATGTKRKVSADRKEEARLRKQERAQAERIRKEEIRERQRERAEQRREELHRKRIEAADARAAKVREKKERAAEKKAAGYPSLFGVAYEKLSPSQQALVRRATANKGKRYAKSVKRYANYANSRKKRNPARRNPEDAAAERYKYFHGKEPETVTEIVRTIHHHEVTSGIGKLHRLQIAAVDGRNKVTLAFKGTLLTQNEKGTQLFIEGGDQSVAQKDFGIEYPHEWEVLGSGLAIWYDTTKTHLGADGGKAIYRHSFGGKLKNGKKSRKPIIVYDTVNKQLYFAGGGYTLPDVGIDG